MGTGRSPVPNPHPTKLSKRKALLFRFQIARKALPFPGIPRLDKACIIPLASYRHAHAKTTFYSTIGVVCVRSGRERY